LEEEETHRAVLVIDDDVMSQFSIAKKINKIIHKQNNQMKTRK